MTIADIASKLNLSESHVRTIIRQMGIVAVKHKGKKPIYSASQMALIKTRNTKPGRKPNGR